MHMFAGVLWLCLAVLHGQEASVCYLLLFLQQHWEIDQEIDPQVRSNPN